MITYVESVAPYYISSSEPLCVHDSREFLLKSSARAPSNPKGAILDESSLRHIAEMAIINDLVVISDEEYDAITYDGFRHISLASLAEMKNRTISVFSLSKTYAMTGCRVGYTAANPEITGQMIKL